MSKKSFILFIVSFILYLFQNLLRGLFIGSFNLNSILSELISIAIVLFIVYIFLHKKENRIYYGLTIHNTKSILLSSLVLCFIPLVNIPYLFKIGDIDIIYILISSIFIGIMEELIFRGFLYRFLEDKFGINKAVVLSSIIFGLFHLVNLGSISYFYVLLQVIYATAIGIAFSVVYSKTKSIVSCIIIHSIVDFIGSFSTQPILIVEIIGTLSCCICALYYYIVLKNRNIG